MPRYYFDLKFDGEKSSYDEEGTALRDTEAAQLEAARSLSEFSRETETAKGALREISIIVRDDTGPVLRAILHFEIERLS